MGKGSRLWGGQAAAGLLLGALTLFSVVAAWRIAVPADPPAVALKSPTVFRAEIFVGCFFFGYIVLGVVIHTVRLGRPPRRLGFGLVSFESEEIEKTVEALDESAAALRALEGRLTQVEATLGISPEPATDLRQARERFEATVDALRRLVEGS